MRTTVTVTCRGNSRSGTHHKRRLARYSWSAADGVWVRVDRHGSNSDWFVDTDLKAYPRPVFECPCGHRAVYTHDELQSLLQQAASEDRDVTV